MKLIRNSDWRNLTTGEEQIFAYADDIVLVTKNYRKLFEKMLIEVVVEGKKIIRLNNQKMKHEVKIGDYIF